MGFTLVGWNESQDSSAGLTQVAALADQHVTPQGDDILVPDRYPLLVGVFAGSAALSRVQITAPSMREKGVLDVAPVNVGDEPTFPTPWQPMWDRPQPLEPGEGLRALVQDTTGGASQSYVFAWLQGEFEPIPDGDILTIRCTSSTTLTAEAWSLCTLTISQQLAAGTYAVVGMRVESAGARAARLVFANAHQRPGCIAYDAAGDVEDARFRRGGLGQSWGTFSHVFLPQVEVLSTSADTSEIVWLDLVKLA